MIYASWGSIPSLIAFLISLSVAISFSDFKSISSDGRQIFTIPNKAVVCTARTDKLPITMDELKRFSSPNANEFTIFYTVWSYEKGYGRLILNYLLRLLNTNRYVNIY